MNRKSPRNKLNPKQIHILKLLFKFRFVTAGLLASYKNVRVSAVNKSLAVLVDSGYINRQYEANYKIQGKGATYYLAPKALTYLRDNHEHNERILHSMYKNKSVGQAFIDHHLTAFAAYLALRNSYPEGSFHIFSRTELGDFDYFPELRPDLYLNRTKPSSTNPNEYMLDIFTDSQLFIMKKRVAALVEHYESGDWEADAETGYPVILFVCPDARVEERLSQHIVKTLDNMGIDELKIYVTTVRALLESTKTHKAVWSDINTPGTLLQL